MGLYTEYDQDILHIQTKWVRFVNALHSSLKAMSELNAGQKYCRMLHGYILQVFWTALSDN